MGHPPVGGKPEGAVPFRPMNTHPARNAALAAGSSIEPPGRRFNGTGDGESN